jgi:hypothetical protein
MCHSSGDHACTCHHVAFFGLSVLVRNHLGRLAVDASGKALCFGIGNGSLFPLSVQELAASPYLRSLVFQRTLRCCVLYRIVHRLWIWRLPLVHPDSAMSAPMNFLLASSMTLLASCASIATPAVSTSGQFNVRGRPYEAISISFAAGTTSISSSEVATGMIRRHLGENCSFEIEQTFAESFGTNGRTSKFMRTSTCRGETFFEFIYWPPDFFPRLPAPYELKEWVPKHQPRPDA